MTAAQPEHPYTIVVGVSATSKSSAALVWAVEQAGLRHGRVIAVRAWRPPVPTSGSRGTPPAVTLDIPAAEAAAREELVSDVADSLGAGHDVEVRLVRGGRRKTLVDESLGADLLVVDAPGGAMAASPLSVQRLVRRAGCPVVVMPPPTRSHGAGKLAQASRHAARSISEAAGRAGRPGIRPAPPG